MSSGRGKARGRTAAWRISTASTLVFAVGATLAFLFLHQYVSREIQRRSDAWLTGEVEVLGDVAERTPKGILYDTIVDEVAELATKEVPNDATTTAEQNEAVFFLEMSPRNTVALWVGKGASDPFWSAIRQASARDGVPTDVPVAGFLYPFRVVSLRTTEGNHVYLGLSERGDRRVLRRMRAFFMVILLAIVLLGFALVFVSTRRTLDRVQRITETAARIGQDDLKSRVPAVRGHDEISQLAVTVNGMLDRIERAVNQLHTITDALAHDLCSPMTAIRGRLETALLAEENPAAEEQIAAAVEELDRLSDILTKSLDVAEARADALRLKKVPVDVDDLVRTMADLYEPSMLERGLRVEVRSAGPLLVAADAGLMHRMVANLFDNAVKHLSSGMTTRIALSQRDGFAVMAIEDDGPGFPPEKAGRIFEKFAKGSQSTGSGLGLAFVEAVVRAHDGRIAAANLPVKGISLVIELPIEFPTDSPTKLPVRSPETVSQRAG